MHLGICIAHSLYKAIAKIKYQKRYEKKSKRVYFNKEQYFEGISKEVWEYQIGGYQVMAKYLKDRRKGMELSEEEIKHYMRVVKAIERTIEVQEGIDGVFGKVEEARG